ncbi:RluA family pseudouridine synthase [Leptospira sp. WS92.C1]
MSETHSNFKIFYEDTSFVFAEKPPGIPVHATKDSQRTNFADQLQKQLGLEFLRTVNRLDLDTSGLVFFCKNPEDNKEADRILKASIKIYLCVARGIVEDDHFTEICYLKDGNKKVKKVFSGGDKAVTEFITIKRNVSENVSILLAKLHTGRRHQIRFHLCEKGHPILGDLVYGVSNVTESFTKKRIGTNKLSKTIGHFVLEESPNKKPSKLPNAKRSLLHALGVSFQTKNGNTEQIFCPPPSDFQRWISGIELDASIFSKFSVK